MSITDGKTLDELDGPTDEELARIERDLNDDDFWASEDNRLVEFPDDDRESAED